MRKLLDPKWLLIINTAPIVLMFFLYWSEYNIIKSLLPLESLILWKDLGLALTIISSLNLLYTLFLIFKKKQVSVYYGIAALLCYISFLYVYGNNIEEIIPWGIPRWMVPGNLTMYAGTFLMPTLAYALFILVAHLTSEEKEHKAWKNFIIAICVPLAWYLFSQILIPFWRPVGNDFSMHVFVIFVITGTLVFLFFLIRGIYILGMKKSDFWKKYQLIWKIPFAVVFPFLGLAVNNGHIFNDFRMDSSGIFGDFNSPWFYILALLGGILTCLPSLENKAYRLLLFIGRSFTFAYTFYFFIIFLPYLPLSVIAIVAIGVGFLMLTPLLLFVIQLNDLVSDFTFLKQYYSPKIIRVVSVAIFLVLPSYITVSYMHDRSVLIETLDYLYNPDYSKTYNIDKTSLKKTLGVVKQHKERNGDEFFGDHLPYLSSYFNWIVLDNLTLSDAKINHIEAVFGGKPMRGYRDENIRNQDVSISKITSKSTYDKQQNSWTSWVDLEITNSSENNFGFSEYATTLELPDGCWISDYYLYVLGKKEMGILAEKKSAMWVFSNIRNENRDPGILYYLTGNKVAFRVFPFVAKEVRKTGIELIHKEPIKFKIDSHVVELGNPIEQVALTNTQTADKNIVYVSAKEKAALPKVKRIPYYHFLVDVSGGKEKCKDDYINRIEKLISKGSINSDFAKLSFVNTYTDSAITFKTGENLKQHFNNQKYEGGYYLDRAIRKSLIDSYNNVSNTYPVIITLTDSIQDAILDKNFADLQMTFPETYLFYDFTKTLYSKPHSLLADPLYEANDTLTFKYDHTVLAYPNAEHPIAYLPNNNKASIVLKNQLFETNEAQIKEKNWQSALTMQGKWMSQILHPEESDKEWLNLVKYSFISKVMIPVTSYLVVETEAQKAILKKKQEQVLASNKSLDLGEDTPRMSEPGLMILAGMLGLLLFYREKKKRKLIKG